MAVEPGTPDSTRPAMYPGMKEAVHGVRIFDISMVAPKGALNCTGNSGTNGPTEGVEVRAEFATSHTTRIWMNSEDAHWTSGSPEYSGTGEAVGIVGRMAPGDLNSITFSVKTADGEQRTIYTLPIDIPYVWEARPLTEAQEQRLIEAKLAAEKKRLEKMAALDEERVPVTALVTTEVKMSSGAAPAPAAAQLAGKELVALYFSAHWCGPCRQFTPKLVAFVEALREEDGIELPVIFGSSDKDQASFDDYFASMPWYAFPHGDKRIEALKSKYSVDGIPWLVVLDAKGNLVMNEADTDVPKGTPAYQKWLQAAKKIMPAAGAPAA